MGWRVRHDLLTQKQMSETCLNIRRLVLRRFRSIRADTIELSNPLFLVGKNGSGIRSFARNTQIVVTTHSPELLDAKWNLPEHLRIVTWREGVTRAQSLGEASKKALREHLMGAGEQLRSNALRAEEVDVFAEPNDQLELFEDGTLV